MILHIKKDADATKKYLMDQYGGITFEEKLYDVVVLSSKVKKVEGFCMTDVLESFNFETDIQLSSSDYLKPMIFWY